MALQTCAACKHVIYPAREICPKCWSMDLQWQDIPDGGELIAETTLRTSVNTYFRERMPWRIGTSSSTQDPWCSRIFTATWASSSG